jgi:spermidine synthase
VQLPFYERLPYWQFGISHALERRPHVYPLYLGAQSAMAFAWMLPLTVLAGAALPVAIGAFAARSGRMGAGVGALLTANTMGNVVGPLVATFVLFPLVGLRYTVSVGVVLLCGAALLAWWSDEAVAQQSDRPDTAGPGARRGAMVIVASGIVLLSLLPPTWDPVSMHAGGFRRWTTEPGASYSEYRQARSTSRSLWSADGPADSVAVIETRDGGRFMKVNGKTDASDREDLPTQRLVAHIPLVLHEANVGPGPREVFVVGLGSGATAGSASLHPDVEVTVAELSGAVIDASHWFTHVNHDVHARPNVQVRRADAREWLARAPGPWDVIINQPSNPWIAGNAALFSREFFALARDRLAPDGVFAQWMHVYAMDDATLRVVLETFASVFPHVTMWWPQGVDLLLVGSLEPLSPDLDLIAERIAAPWFTEDMAPLRDAGAAATNLPRFLSLQVLSDPGFRAAFAGTPPFTTDAHALVEHRAPRAQFVGQRSELLLPLDERTHAGEATQLYLGGLGRGEWHLDDLLEFFAARDTPFSTRLAGSLQHAATGESVRSWDAAPAEMEGMATRATGLPIVFEAWSEAMLAAPALSVEDCRVYLEMGHRVLPQRASVYHLPEVADFDAVVGRCGQAAGEAARPFLVAIGAEALAASGHGDRARQRAQALLDGPLPDEVRRAMETVVGGAE